MNRLTGKSCPYELFTATTCNKILWQDLLERITHWLTRQPDQSQANGYQMMKKIAPKHPILTPQRRDRKSRPSEAGADFSIILYELVLSEVKKI